MAKVEGSTLLIVPSIWGNSVPAIAPPIAAAAPMPTRIAIDQLAYFLKGVTLKNRKMLGMNNKSVIILSFREPSKRGTIRRGIKTLLMVTRAT